jgi:tRNA A37 threonylcarbamoyladenosine modification protein TsaB
MAVIAETGVEKQEYAFDRRLTDLAGEIRQMTRGRELTKVAVAVGPGSFTGLRFGVSFGLGLAIGLKIPIVPLPTLELHAARSDSPVIAVSEAGRGRLYYLVPGGTVALGTPEDIPKTHAVVGFVSAATEAALLKAGHRIAAEGELKWLSEAAMEVLKTAREVAYSSLKLEYMQSFSPPVK